MWARPAVKAGANVPEPYRMKEMLQDKEAMEKHAAKVSPPEPLKSGFSRRANASYRVESGCKQV